MTDSYDVIARLEDLQDQSERKYMHTESGFLNEEEQAEALRRFPESSLIRYEGGYPGALKKKVIFLRDEEDDFSDIVCIIAAIDQRFRKITHRDVLGSLMSLQIDRHSFGDFWIEPERIVLYTSHQMAKFLCDNLLRISSLSVSFEPSEEHPVQVFHRREFEAVVSSERMDVLVACLANISRAKAVSMIREGKVQLNHRPLVKPDEVCDNDSTISIRGSGRYHFLGIVRRTRKDRIVVRFSQDIQEGERKR
ncbi:MAG: RNA-binding protein [Solobacterium sp.]|nr:RNA-binding protein [Solobacterium sp.]